MTTYGVIISADIERSTLDTDDIIISLTKKKSAFDVTGWTTNITVNTIKDGTGTLVFEASGVVYGDTANGQLSIDMSLFGAVAAGKYFYDIRIIDSNSRGRESLAGKFTVVQRIAHS